MKPCTILFLTLATSHMYGQMDTSTIKTREMGQTVVTATRTPKLEKDIAVPMALIDGKQIKLSGLTRLNEILAEQTGLTLVSDHGTGIQIQGFDPAYTMVLIDGEPLLGRTAGTLELSRITLRNVKRIEILKGGGSCLYGSEAMGGVLNIITYPPSELPEAGAFVRYGSFTTSDIGIDGGSRIGKVSWYGFLNRYSTKGYDLQPERQGVTTAPFSNYTATARLFFPILKSWEARVSARIFTEQQKPSFLYADGLSYNQHGTITDGNFTFSAEKRTNNGWGLKNKYYHSLYSAKSHLVLSNGMDEGSSFLQAFQRVESTAEKAINVKHLLNSGIGLVHEELKSDRYSGRPAFNSFYVFLQDDWRPVSRLNIIGGLRFDHHGAFGDQLSPKLSILHKTAPWLRLKASYGSGFKAPDFRQLYLDFSNPVVGYSVFGTRNVQARTAELKSQGLITRTFSALDQVNTLQAEVSRSFNVGFVIEPTKGLELSFNAFRNNILHLIESLPVAEKSNGQFIYSYINLNKVITQGIELNLKIPVHRSVQVSAGYQYLQAYDPSVIESIDKGEIFLKDPESTRTVVMKRKYYKGLYNRSPHSANFKINHSWKKAGIETALRFVYRSKFGFADANGNLILDVTDIYVPGYLVANLSVSKNYRNWSAQLSMENLGNFKEPVYLPSTPGRLFNLAIFWKLNPTNQY